MKLSFDWPSGFRGDVRTLWTTTDGQTDDDEGRRSKGIL